MGKKKYQEYWNYIQEHNKGRHSKTKEKLYTRVLSARTRWANKYNISKEDIDKIIKEGLGKKCPYCGKKVTTENMSLDHKNPRASGGGHSLENLHLIDNKCNKRKGKLSHEDYKKLWDLIRTFDKESQTYLKRKLSAQITNWSW